MSNNMSKPIIKIPETVSIIIQKNTLFCISSIGVRSLKLNVKVLFFKTSDKKKFLKVTDSPYFDKFLTDNKKRKMLQGTAISLIKKLLKDITLGTVQKLKLVGVGFRIFIHKKSKINLFFFKLGYSHNVYFKIPNNIQVECPKPTLIFISGTNTQEVNNFGALIRSLKKPEPYKGKGFLYENEKIVLKEGKKN